MRARPYDTRNGDEANESQDIYSAAVQFDRLAPSTPPAAQYGLAAAAGVAAFGVILLVLSAVRKRRTGGPPSALKPRSDQRARAR